MSNYWKNLNSIDTDPVLLLRVKNFERKKWYAYAKLGSVSTCFTCYNCVSAGRKLQRNSRRFNLSYIALDRFVYFWRKNMNYFINCITFRSIFTGRDRCFGKMFCMTRIWLTGWCGCDMKIYAIFNMGLSFFSFLLISFEYSIALNAEE